MINAIGLSGGKDSTVLAFLLKETEPETDWTYICTPTGSELLEMEYHWLNLEKNLGKPLVRITNPKAPTLDSLINIHNAVPNFQQRWCTRQLKIEPTIAWCLANAPVLMHVGLRADESEREGIYGNTVKSRFPFREIGWGIKQVLQYAEGLKERFGIVIPVRTDCDKCYHQRLEEWWNLWLKNRPRFSTASAQEITVGHTFRSPGRDKWPVSLVDLGSEFQRLWDNGCHNYWDAWNMRMRIEKGKSPMLPKKEKRQGELCRVCSL